MYHAEKTIMATAVNVFTSILSVLGVRAWDVPCLHELFWGDSAEGSSEHLVLV
jgi:hypothetical protein